MTPWVGRPQRIFRKDHYEDGSILRIDDFTSLAFFVDHIRCCMSLFLEAWVIHGQAACRKLGDHTRSTLEALRHCGNNARRERECLFTGVTTRATCLPRVDTF